MAIVIQHRCQRCGARWEGGQAGSAWVRCASCSAIVDFDWLGFFESKAYSDFLAQSAQAAQHGWPRYQAAIAEADALAQKGDLAGALPRYRAAVEALTALTPFMYPPEVTRDPAYREQLLAFQAWWLLQCRVDPKVAPLQRELEAAFAKVDMQRPLPALEKAADIFARQSERLGQSDAPPDPDGMAPAQRARIWVSVTLGAWIRMLSAEDRVALLKRLHGADVKITGDVAASDDEVGLYVEWACPGCGLHSLQARGSPMLVCPACMFQRPFAAGDAPLAATNTRCPGCGADVQVPGGALQGRCGYCGAVASRLGETGAVTRAFVAEAMHKAAGAHGVPSLPPGGQPGLPVTAANREDLVSTGLARIATYYNAFIHPPRLARLWKASARAVGKPPLALAPAVRRHSQAEGATPQAKALLEAAEALLKAEGS